MPRQVVGLPTRQNNLVNLTDQFQQRLRLSKLLGFDDIPPVDLSTTVPANLLFRPRGPNAIPVSLFGGKLVFASEAALARHLTLPPDPYHVVSFPPNLLGGPPVSDKKLIATVTDADMLPATVWVPADHDPEYLISNALTLKKRDGGPVGWISLSRYADIIGIPRHVVIRTWAGHRVNALFAYRHSLPFATRSVDTLPHTPMVQFSPIHTFWVPLNAYGSASVSTTAALASNIHDEFTLMDLSRLFRDRGRNRGKRTENRYAPGDAVCDPNPVYDGWVLCDPTLGNPLYSLSVKFGPTHKWVHDRAESLHRKIDPMHGISGQISRAIEVKFASVIHMMKAGSLRNAKTTSARMVRAITSDAFRHAMTDIVAGGQRISNRVEPSMQWPDDMVDLLEGRREAGLAAIQRMLPTSLDEALQELATSAAANPPFVWPLVMMVVALQKLWAEEVNGFLLEGPCNEG